MGLGCAGFRVAWRVYAWKLDGASIKKALPSGQAKGDVESGVSTGKWWEY